ncbi:MAG: acyltransferase family protein [Oligoflexales bacterium]|nr:acyltransferase family protein [Oligoflexales bacterium]
MMLERGDDINPSVVQKVYPILNAIRQYHSYEVHGLEHVPEKGRAIIACNHSLATYDIALLFLEIYDRIGRIPRPLADHLFFKIPYLGELIEELGAVDGDQTNALSLLEKDELIGVAPGGMREALRPSSERYQILWDRRKGFARLAMETNAPVIVAVCPKADDLYDVYHNPLTAWAYKKFKVPLFMARGVAFTPIPKKVKLMHFLSEPIYPPSPKDDPKAFKRQLDRFHKKIVKKTQDLIGEAIAFRETKE